MKQLHDAHGAGQVTPGSDEAPAGDAAQGFQEGTADKANSTSVPTAAQALKVIDGERKAREYLARLHAQQADTDELALIVAPLYGAVLRGFCNAITKALRGGSS